MKVNLNLENRNNRDISFGYKWSKDENGFRTFETSYVFDPNRQDCYLEVFNLDKDFYNNYKIVGQARTRKGSDNIKLNPDSNKIDMLKEFGITPDTPFAYHYKVVDKKFGYNTIEIDAGDSISENNFNGEKIDYNIVVPNASSLSKGGSMKLVNIDSQNVGVIYNKDGSYKTDKDLQKRSLDAVKTLTNVFGGTAAGLEKDIDEGKYDGYSRIISLPVFTREDFTSHKYWIEDIYQPCNSLMNINNYASLQKKMFAHDLNFVSDGAFVNEGLQGVHFSNVLKWGTDSPYYRWFRADNLKNAPLSLGVFPKNTENVSHKLVNSPKIYYQTDTGRINSRKNDKYDPSKPTYIQFFDKRLVTEEERRNPQYLIKSYSKLNTDNLYKLHTHDDSTFPYAFEINPKAYQRNVDHFNELGIKDILLDSYEAARILSKNENFVVDGKFESGFETWDANPDIAKLNFVMSNNDLKNLKNMKKEDALKEEALLNRAHAQVQDYTVEGGKYWTQKTNDILRLHIAQNLKNIEPQNPQKVYQEIIKKSDNKLFPKSLKAEITKEEVENVIDDFYYSDRKLSEEDKKSQILEQLMNFPMESIEFGTNLVGVLASPMVTKRASTEAEIGVPRYEIFRKGNPNLPKEYAMTYNTMEDIYQNQMLNFATSVLNDVNKKLPENAKLFDQNEVTEYGKYVLPLIVPQIAKFSIVKGLVPKAEVNVNSETGEISYNYNQLLNTHIESLDLPKASSVQNETMMILEKLKEGISKISGKDQDLLKDSILKSLNGTSAESFKLADLIIDKTQAGLDWRIDATKDIADIDALRTHKQPFEDIWNDVIGFWKKFTQGVLKENPNSYIVAEITNDDELHDSAYGSFSPKYPNKHDVIQKFLRETGITATANYTQYFYNIAKLFSKSFQDGTTLDGDENTYNLAEKFKQMLISGDEKAMLKAFSLPAIMYSYSFIDNHDKPRALHCAALDMEIFYISDFTKATDVQKKQAFKLLTDSWDDGTLDYHKFVNYNFSAVSPKAVAMGLLLRKSFVDSMNEYRGNKIPEHVFNRNYEAISKALADLSGGKFKDSRFDADSFGVKPIDVNISKVIEQAKYKYGYNLPDDVTKALEDRTFEISMRPAMTKLLAMMKVLAALPGMPTMYDGDDLGASGYDTETKNMYLQGRQRVHNEWAEENNPRYKEFVAEFKKEFDKVMALRRKPECNALNNGTPFVLPMQDGEYDGIHYNVPAVLQKAPDGRMTISLFNLHRWTNGQRFNYDNQHSYYHKKMYLDAVKLNFDNNGQINNGKLGVGVQGIKPGTKFVNANNEDEKFIVVEHDGKYFLKKEDGNGLMLDDTTMVLYHVPESTPLSFTGQYHIKQNINTVMNAYLQKNHNIGKQLSLMSN